MEGHGVSLILLEQTNSLSLRSLETQNGQPLIDRVLTISARDGFTAELTIAVNGEIAKFDLTEPQARMVADFLAEVGGKHG